MTACCLQTMNNKISRAFSSICFHTLFFFFSFPFLGSDYDPALAQQCIPWLKQSLPAPAHTCCPQVPPCHKSPDSPTWGQAVLTPAAAQTGNYQPPTRPQPQHSMSQACIEHACRQLDPMGQALPFHPLNFPLFFFSFSHMSLSYSTETNCLLSLKLITCTECAQSMDSPIISTASSRKLLVLQEAQLNPVLIFQLSVIFSICVIWRSEL